MMDRTYHCNLSMVVMNISRRAESSHFQSWSGEQICNICNAAVFVIFFADVVYPYHVALVVVVIVFVVAIVVALTHEA